MELFFLALLILIMASALASGYPVAFSLPGAAIITISLAALAGWLFAGNPDAYFHQGGPGQWLSAGVTNFRGIYWEVERDTLIAIPLFIFMGIMLQRSKIAEDLLVTMAQLFGPVPGGLGISVVFVGALLAATTGILGATVVAMGLISLPAMLRNKYSTPLATGTIAASGTLGQIIPPSIVLIILADQLSSAVDQASNARKTLYKATTGEVSMPSEFSLVSASAGDMFLGALIPGLVLVGLYMLYIFITALIKPEKAPAVPFEGTYDRKFAAKVSITLVPPLTLIFVVLGSILLGVATVNQAGAIGAIGAMIMAGYRLKEGEKNAYTPAIIAIASLIVIGVTLSLFETNVKSETSSGLGIAIAAIAVVALLIAVIWSGWRTLKIDDTLKGVMIETAKTTSLVFIILLGAAMLTAAFRAFGGEELVREFLTSLPGGFWAQFFIVMLVIFLLGFFLDFIEIAVVVVPIVAPILLSDPSANITAVWLGVMIGMNIQTSFLTPPFGFALFYLRGVAPAIVKTIDMYKGVIPFIALQLLALAIVGLVPPLANYLPARVSMLSETAPPPLNPRLQYCIEEFLFDDYQAQKQTLTAAISEAQAIDLSYLPKKERKALEDAFERAGTIYTLLDDISTAETARDAAVAGYKPLHTSVRRIESQIRRVESDLKANDSTLQRLKRNASSDPQRIERLQKRVDSLTAELEALKAQVPANWEERHKAFAELQNADASARKKYRTTADRSYDPVRSALKELEDETDWDALAGKIAGLKAVVDAEEPKQASKLIGDVGKEVGRAAGGKAIKKEIDKARKLARARKPDPEKTKAAIDEALAVLEEEKAWRARAQAELLPSLQKYEETIRDTIGLRLQPKLSRDQALKVAACNSNHRDLSLSF